jgi:predicted ATP-dependent serine protease
VAPPSGSAFVGEVALTGQVRSAPSMVQRLSAARAAGCSVVYASAGGPSEIDGVRVLPVRHVRDALDWGVPGDACPL